MKKTIGIVGGIALCLFTLSVNAQTVPQTTPEPVKTWNPKSNPTVDSITSQYTPKYIAPKPAITQADIFPVIGKYESATNPDAASITITLDAQNKGLVWIEGLPQGMLKAMLRKSPATYKIPVQKTEDGKEIPEGTLIFEKETGSLSICIGKSYNAENPALAFSTAVTELEVAPATTKKNAKSKKPAQPKPWIYTGTKMATETVAK
jgi:hypothetical protein